MYLYNLNDTIDIYQHIEYLNLFTTLCDNGII